MMQGMPILDAVIAVVALVVGFVLHKSIADRKLGEASTAAKRIIATAQRDADALHRSKELEGKESPLKLRTEFEGEVRRREREMQQMEQRVLAKEEELARKLDQMERKLNDYTEKERTLATREKAILDRENRLSVAMDEQRRKLESIAGLTAEEAKRQ